MNEFFEIDERLNRISDEVENKISGRFKKIDSVTEYNQQKMLASFVKNRVSESSFAASTGYGYGDIGRETIERVFADAVGAEDALFRHNFVSGTHALCVALFGVLRTGDTVVCVSSEPYDTIRGVFGITPADGSLAEFGIKYEQIDLLEDSSPDFNAIEKRLKDSFVKVIYIQRSRGYSLRKSLSVETIGEICALVKSVSPKTVVMVDNCYGEFTEKNEPVSVGADLIIGSLIKNAGGGIAPTGGYIAGRHDLVELCAGRLTTPSTGREVGATLGLSRELFMGLFNAPHVTGEAIKTAVYAAALFERLGFSVSPTFDEDRSDIIELICLESPERLVEFCKGIQKCAPVDSFATPEPWDMPGYDDKVIMAAGAFTLGASIELSADAPIREPYTVWMQGGLNFHSAKVGVLAAADLMLKKGYIEI